jgi:hypothetical protein
MRRIVCIVLTLLLTGCVPIGARVQNMLATGGFAGSLRSVMLASPVPGAPAHASRDASASVA